MRHQLRIWRYVGDDGELALLGEYDCGENAPWVPPVGSFYRFRDHHPPNRPVDHTEVVGYVKDVVTVMYGGSVGVSVEIYIKPRV